MKTSIRLFDVILVLATGLLLVPASQADELSQAAVVLVNLFHFVIGALVPQNDLQPLVQEREFTQPVRERVKPKVSYLKDPGIGPELYLRTRRLVVTIPR